uniref:Uncharacterized protein n=1 Tax=Aegilops tauschii subsp. strangulata TaxID=200361 RepID=A0A453HKG4_AEGTS
KFPRRTPSGINPLQPQQQQPEEQQSVPQSSNQSGQNSAPMAGAQASASANADVTSNNSLSCAPSTSAPSPTVMGILQGSIDSSQDHLMSSANGQYNSGNNGAIPKVNSASSLQSNPSTANGLRMAVTNNAMAMNGRMGMHHSAHDLSQLGHQQQQQQQQQQQHDIGNQLLGGLRAGNSFNNLQYDWKPSQ